MRLSISPHRAWAAFVALALVLALVSVPSSDAAPGRTPYSVDASGRPMIHNSGQAYLNAHLPVRSRVETCWPDDAGREDRPDDPGRAGRGRRRPDADHDPAASARCCPAAARRPTPNTPDGLGRHGRRATSRTRWPPGCRSRCIYGVDAVHGHGNVLGATIFPHNIGLGATRDPALVAADRRTSPPTETRATGIPWDFAPCVCVARDDRWGRTYESFGEDPALVESDGDRHRRPAGHATARPDERRPGARHRQALRRRRRHHLRHRRTTGDYTIDQGVTVTQPRRLRRHRPGAVRAPRSSAPRRLRHAVVLQRRLDRGRRRQPGQDARQQAS